MKASHEDNEITRVRSFFLLSDFFYFVGWIFYRPLAGHYHPGARAVAASNFPAGRIFHSPSALAYPTHFDGGHGCDTSGLYPEEWDSGVQL